MTDIDKILDAYAGAITRASFEGYQFVAATRAAIVAEFERLRNQEVYLSYELKSVGDLIAQRDARIAELEREVEHQKGVVYHYKTIAAREGK